jgi:hypothetical protein
MIGIGPSLSDLLEDHMSESRSAAPGPLERIRHSHAMHQLA